MPSSTYTHTDDVMEGLQGFFDVLAKNSKLVIAFGVLIAAGGATMALIANHNQERSDAGRNALYLADKTLDTELRAIAKAQAPAVAPVEHIKGKKTAKPAQPAAPNPDSVLFTKFDVDSQLGGAVEKLKSVAAAYAGTRPGMEAILQLGKLYLYHGEPAKAETWFRQAASQASTKLDRAVAWSSVADALEDQGKAQDALSAINQAISAGESSLAGDLMLDQARIYESLKNRSQAKAIYQQIQTQFPNSEYAKFASLYSASL